MAEVIYNVTFTPTVGAMGTLIEYKNADDSVWLTPDSPANPTTLATYPLSLETGNSYNIRVSAYGCPGTPRYKLVNVTVEEGGPCCPEGYYLSPDEAYCYQENTVSPTIIDTGLCLAQSQLASQYSVNGACLYEPGYTTRLVGSYTSLTAQPQWMEIPLSVDGPMNRDGIWVDSDCNGTKDPLTEGLVVNFTYPLTVASPSTVYVGIGGDNTFKLEVNGTTIVDCDETFPAQGGPSGANFNFWHIFPVDILSGTNYFSFSSVGDGSTNDSFAAVIYDNTALEIAAATDDSELTILFRTSDLIGDAIEIATCPEGYFLDTSDGPGSYVCRQIITTETSTC